ncbi:hypothetical protein [Thermogemmatispora onikobensis]|uniref:hypothetical protein n=1 Tax=Thermogemmatispora onikobensis TaxID=732234 RepID=UPI00159F16DC|nr:hypothetical protein [Thermogemmatispora onikobensis]
MGRLLGWEVDLLLEEGLIGGGVVGGFEGGFEVGEEMLGLVGVTEAAAFLGEGQQVLGGVEGVGGVAAVVDEAGPAGSELAAELEAELLALGGAGEDEQEAGLAGLAEDLAEGGRLQLSEGREGMEVDADEGRLAGQQVGEEGVEWVGAGL